MHVSSIIVIISLNIEIRISYEKGRNKMSRREAREQAFKILFQNEVNEEQVIELETLNEFTKTIIEGFLHNKQEVDQMISNHLKNWTIHRIALVEKAILRVSTYEMMYIKDVPVGVSINEAIELAHKYGDENSGKFVNGVLSKINKTISEGV